MSTQPAGLVTAEQLAARFQIPVDQLHRLRVRYSWPCVKLGRSDVRFTEGQVAEILELHTERPKPPSAAVVPGAVPGQTARSATYHRGR